MAGGVSGRERITSLGVDLELHCIALGDHGRSVEHMSNRPLPALGAALHRNRRSEMPCAFFSAGGHDGVMHGGA